MTIHINSSRILKYSDLMTTIRTCLLTYWGSNNIQFLSAYPKMTTDKNSIKTPIITYKASKTPGMYQQTREIKPRVRGEVRTVNENGENIYVQIKGQRFTYMTTFEIWAADGEEADRISEKFQSFMFQYLGYFQKCGAKEIIFSRIEADQEDSQWRNDLIRRKIVYQIDIDEVVGVEFGDIKSIDVEEMTYSTELEIRNFPLDSETILKHNENIIIQLDGGTESAT